MPKIPMTKIGLLNLQKKLTKLKNIDRPQVINEIKMAREYGDIKENAEYHAAKEEQLLIEKKINEIEDKIFYANVIDITKIKHNNKITFGATVKLTNLNKKETLIYQITGEDEADIKKNKISIHSPMARSLILKSKNDTITINMPNNTLKYQIKDITYV